MHRRPRARQSAIPIWQSIRPCRFVSSTRPRKANTKVTKAKRKKRGHKTFVLLVSTSWPSCSLLVLLLGLPVADIRQHAERERREHLQYLIHVHAELVRAAGDRPIDLVVVATAFDLGHVVHIRERIR